MKRIALFVLFVLSASLFAQQPAQESVDAMKKLNFLAGEWGGTGTILTGPEGKQTSNVIEVGEFRLDGLLFTFEGRGVADGKVVHNAFGVISYDASKKKYQMRAYTATGLSTDANVTLSENKLVWSFDIPDAGSIRYTITVKGDKWIEVGELSPDKGKTYFKFFEMNLTKAPEKNG